MKPIGVIRGSGEAGGGAENLVCLISEAPADDPFVDLTWQGFERIHEAAGVEARLVEAAENEEQIYAVAEMGANPIYR